ncbi:PAAR domain-containing protein [Acerihabitans sp. KWT182]|uniref:PAAR domain-containing protein n=1 Tax=Acerihabitans sp. KWT182 TaxID=3157919 RepID=A0AAU7QA35_9GAMM
MKEIFPTIDKISCDSTVASVSQIIKIDGFGVGRKGDAVRCLKHGGTTISAGHATFCPNGLPSAFQGHGCACGCTLVLTLSDVTAS